MLKKTIIATCLTLIFVNNALAIEQIRISGSSTLYPLINVVAEEFKKNIRFQKPSIESVGTGGGFMFFCLGEKEKTIDIITASRPIKKREKELCKNNGITDITEIKIGHDGIIVANSKDASKFNFTKRQLFLATAKKVPVNGEIADNPYTAWNQIDPSLPATKIEIYGPPKTSGTRDSFASNILQAACVDLVEFKEAYFSLGNRQKACSLIREDGVYIDFGEDDNLIIAKIKENKNAFGIFGFSYLYHNSTYIQAANVDEIEPTFENISNKKYPLSRPLYIYVNNSHLNRNNGTKDFVTELVSSDSIGKNGYLVKEGLVPLTEDELKQIQFKVYNMQYKK
jgi:phosphate transport system substrate-binding protein